MGGVGHDLLLSAYKNVFSLQENLPFTGQLL